jgi:ABC-type sugar transport system permease subunit
MAVRTETLSQSARVNVRAWLAFLFGLVAVAAIPVAIELTRKVPGLDLLDAAWAIPLAAASAIVALLFARGARGEIQRSLSPVGGAAWIRLGRFLAAAGICVTLSASIAVGLYELLLRLEH